MLPTKFQFIWESGFRGEEFLEINQPMHISLLETLLNR
jgi:hypothetical protein